MTCKAPPAQLKGGKTVVYPYSFRFLHFHFVKKEHSCFQRIWGDEKGRLMIDQQRRDRGFKMEEGRHWPGLGTQAPHVRRKPLLQRIGDGWQKSGGRDG